MTEPTIPEMIAGLGGAGLSPAKRILEIAANPPMLASDVGEAPEVDYATWLESIAKIINDAIANHPRQQCPDGWVTVPKEPTEEMIVAGVHHEHMGDMEGRYKAMLAAAPEPPKAER